ncbi:MAG: hypothetical protein ACOY3I_00090 [Verrucomicrobiota bacterium]
MNFTPQEAKFLLSYFDRFVKEGNVEVVGELIDHMTEEEFVKKLNDFAYKLRPKITYESTPPPRYAELMAVFVEKASLDWLQKAETEKKFQDSFPFKSIGTPLIEGNRREAFFKLLTKEFLPKKDATRREELNYYLNKASEAGHADLISSILDFIRENWGENEVGACVQINNCRILQSAFKNGHAHIVEILRPFIKTHNWRRIIGENNFSAFTKALKKGYLDIGMKAVECVYQHGLMEEVRKQDKHLEIAMRILDSACRTDETPFPRWYDDKDFKKYKNVVLRYFDDDEGFIEDCRKGDVQAIERRVQAIRKIDFPKDRLRHYLFANHSEAFRAMIENSGNLQAVSLLMELCRKEFGEEALQTMISNVYQKEIVSGNDEVFLKILKTTTNPVEVTYWIRHLLQKAVPEESRKNVKIAQLLSEAVSHIKDPKLLINLLQFRRHRRRLSDLFFAHGSESAIDRVIATLKENQDRATEMLFREGFDTALYRGRVEIIRKLATHMQAGDIQPSLMDVIYDHSGEVGEATFSSLQTAMQSGSLETVQELHRWIGPRKSDLVPFVDEAFQVRRRDVNFNNPDIIRYLLEHLPKKEKKKALSHLPEEWREIFKQDLPSRAVQQLLGEGDARWKALTGKSAPHDSLKDQSPYGFNPTLYEKLLPLTQTACRIEGNEGAEMNAYKLSVFFKNEQEADRYLTQFKEKWNTGNSLQIVHDACLFNLPENGLWTSKRWKGLVLKYGPEASIYLQSAPQIELRLKNSDKPFPSSLEELQAIAALVTYKRGGENLEWAKIAATYKLSEKRFERGLSVLSTHHKKEDFLPAMSIDGASIDRSLANYYMTKLDIGDMRGLILGEMMPPCCQSIGDLGSACAVHGMNSENGGFYVWKQKHDGENGHVGTITENDPIVAQSWVWIGDKDEVVFDSFERKRSKYNELCEPFLKRFAEILDRQKHYTKFDDVRLGKGGDTPKDIGFPSAKSLAQPKDYRGFRDSEEQYRVTMKSGKRSK